MKKYDNYKVLEEKYIADLDSNCTILIHEKTHAKILLMSNNDENKVFAISFRTTPFNSTGLPHILEHSVLCGSRKFPVKDPFVELMKSSLNTFLNAFTSPDKTTYPCASCNDKDFANLMDVYLDATLYPNIYKHPEIFKQEGWHYELNDVEGDITINGVVYNEMKGAYSNPDQVMFRESLSSLYPHTTYGVSSGGDPDVIPDLTYQEFLDFHKKYYHPSNSYIILYGNMDMKERLEWIDKEYLSKFDYLEIDSKINFEKPFKSTLYKELKYPIGQEEDEKDKCMLSYNISIGTSEDALLWMSNNILNYVILDAPGAPLKQELINAGIGKAVIGGYQDGLNQPMFSVISKNCNYEKKEAFINTIENTLKNIVRKGIDKKTLLATITRFEFMYRESDFGSTPKGLVYAMNALDTWCYDYNPTLHLEVSSIFEKLKSLAQTNYFEEILEKYYINNSHKSVVAIVGDKNISSQKANSLRKRLDELKSNMTPLEVENLVEETKNLKVYQQTPSTKQELATLPTLKRSDIDDEVIPISNKVHEIEGIKVIQNDYFTNGIGYLHLLFNVDGLEEKYVPYVGLLVKLLGNMSTTNHSYQELDNEINIQTGGINCSNDIYALEEREKYQYVVHVEEKVLFNNVDKGCDLLLEILNSTIFDDYTRLHELISEQYVYLQSRIVSSGHITALTRALSYINYGHKIKDLTSGIGYFQLIERLEKNFESEKENIAEVLKMISKSIFRKDNLVISYTANDEGFSKLVPNINKFSFSSSQNELSYNYQFSKELLNEGFKTPSNVQYVARVGNYVQNGYSYTGALEVFKKALSTDYLWMKVRVDGGAYGCMCGFGVDGNTYFVSYRDPNIDNTLQVYDNILKFIDEFNPDEDDMTKYIIGAIGDINTPLTPYQKGVRSLSLYYRNVTVEKLKEIRHQVINCTKEDVLALRDLVKSVLDENAVCVIGNENKIEQENDRLKNILYLVK